MTDIGFYHLAGIGADRVLPQLLGRTLALGERAVVLCGTSERLKQLDAALWECPDPNWLPHGTLESGDADLQPIWLTTEDEAPNTARFLFLIDGRTSTRLASFDRVFDLFDGANPEEVQNARDRWRHAKAAGHRLTYWQGGRRGWETR
jgi:DNA polymerase III subunit chi